MVKVCKPDGEGTIAGTRGNGEDAPIPDVERRAASPPAIAASARGHYDVNGHPAFGVDGEFERLQRVEPGELLINARGTMEAGHNTRNA
jgi:hypothetical protein